MPITSILKREPCRLIRWIPHTGDIPGSLFTCGRPGRTLGSKKSHVADEVVAKWVQGLPSTEPVIVSLLGKKPWGLSEFSYYSFCSQYDKPHERPSDPTFQEWLDTNYEAGKYTVHEYPTTDLEQIEEENQKKIVAMVLALVTAGRTVVVMDSGGFSRTGSIVSALSSKLEVKFSSEQITEKCPH